MPTMLLSDEVRASVANARQGAFKQVTVDGHKVRVPTPFPSPEDWRDQWIYFLMPDRFNNPNASPNSAWNRKAWSRQGGTFEGIRRQLGYLKELGAGAIWLAPVLKNVAFNKTLNYHGYGIQNFLDIDPRFGSDGTVATAEKEFAALVDEAHARGMYVIMDIVLNHAGRVFDYIVDGKEQSQLPYRNDPYDYRWLDHTGSPDGASFGPDDGVYPEELRKHPDFFRRRGLCSDDRPLQGDFCEMRELVDDYLAVSANQTAIRQTFGPRPVLTILIQIYQYLMARYDIDGYRIDTVKYIYPDSAETFGNAIREFALSIGKRNFFTFGEITGDDKAISTYVGRNSPDRDSYGIDAALDFPVSGVLAQVAKAQMDVGALRRLFKDRKEREEEILSTHGDASRYFVTFLDNHDRYERFHHPRTPDAQVLMGLALLCCLQGIPCLYYGTEQALTGTVDGQDCFESVREALWGKNNAFDRKNAFYQAIKRMAQLRGSEPALRYGRQYFREVSADGINFGHSFGSGIVAVSRILGDREVLVVANTSAIAAFNGWVLVDDDLNRRPRTFTVAYSNRNGQGKGVAQPKAQIRVWHDDGTVATTDNAALNVVLQPMEVQILT